jgi:hypothetical protein
MSAELPYEIIEDQGMASMLSLSLLPKLCGGVGSRDKSLKRKSLPSDIP